jgi:DNA-binding NarL/FixJ family response regulator
MEFWIVGQIIIDIVLLLLFFYLIRMTNSPRSVNISTNTVGKLTEAIEPLLRDAERVATAFESQLKEKHQIVRKLNEHLDDRILSLNLLLNRAELYNKEFHEQDKKSQPKSRVANQQKLIVRLAQQGLDSESIAKKLSISVGEVKLVLDLKKEIFANGDRGSSSMISTT